MPPPQPVQSEAFLVLALPHSARAGDDVHVSLFVAPRLASTDPDATLAAFGPFRTWSARAAAATVTLRDQDGDIPCTPRLAEIERGIWRRLFPGSTPVRSQQVPDWSKRPVNSFDTRNVTTLAKTMHLTSMLASPTTPPTVGQNPLTPTMLRFAERFRRPDPRYPESPHRPSPRTMYDEAMATAALDDWLAGSELPRIAGAVADFNEDVTSFEMLAARAALELHRARRFYERPESAMTHRDRPDPSAVAAPLKPKAPEFHERCATVGDHPALLRKLGLVIDLHVDDVARLAQSQWLQGEITVPGAVCKKTRVRCRRTTDGSLVTVAATGDWQDGALALGNADRFEVLDIDTDGSALKSDRFLWSIPRLAQVEDNGDEVNGANPALRAAGFTVARTGQAETSRRRVETQQEYDAALAAGTELTTELSTEDVTRGMRVEVWDDRTRRWCSLHRRLTDVAVEGFGTVLDGLDDEGFIQGTAASQTPGAPATAPVYVHEAMFGWEGWSLAAPRPGKRLRKATPAELKADPDTPEIVEDTPTDKKDEDRKPPHAFRFTNHVKPGTLPRLRFGRSYAFRAWQVDLAGNSRPHRLDPEPAAPLDQVAAAVHPLLATGVSDGAALWSRAFRQATTEVVTARDLADAPAAALDLDTDVTRLVAARFNDLAARRAVVPGAAVATRRRALVDRLAAVAVTQQDRPLVVDTAVTDVSSLGPLVASHLSSALEPIGAGPGLADLAVKALATVTPLKPFLRWDPVQPPAFVARRRFTEGESLRVLVVRSGVTQDKDTLAVTVTDPATYAAAVSAAHPDYWSTSERHLAPPKTTEMTAELHGKFDPGIGDGAQEKALADKMLAEALTEDGSFLDPDRADLDHPAQRVKQPQMSLVTSSTIPQAEPKTLPLGAGVPPAPGQYVVHDVDDLTLPYLPDPMAEGVSFVFPEAGRDRNLPFPFAAEGFTTPYSGQWPRTEPYRLVLDGSDELGGRVEGRVVRLRLPAGDVQKVSVSSSLPRDQLEVFGPWRTLPDTFTGNAEVVEAAVDGWLWGLTPAESVTLVHAVPRPLEAPRPTSLRPQRREGQTSMTLLGGLDVHGPSTDSVSGEASWTEVVDDLTLPRWTSQPAAEVAFTTRISDFEDLAVLAGTEKVGNIPGVGRIGLHDLTHRFADTRHRLVTYRFRASTRFREYFAPDLLAPDPANPLDDGRSVVSAPVEVDVPSSARPAAPVVHSVIPLFRWDQGAEPEQPMARRHVRRAGVRIYLQRPWFSSGDGELLAVLMAPAHAAGPWGAWMPGSDVFGPEQDDQSGFPFVSKVGGDPVWLSAEVGNRAMQPLALDNLLAEVGYDDRVDPARPVALPAGTFDLPAFGTSYPVRVAGYRPQFSEERGLWYVDVALDPGHTAWSFVRLAVARYQPSSIDGCHLSAPVRCDFVQLPPERTSSVSRTDTSHVRVVLSGPVGAMSPWTSDARRGMLFADAVAENRSVVARLQRKDPAIASDLGWTTVATTRLTIRSADPDTFEVAWVGNLDAGEDVLIRRPLDPATPPPGTPASTWRVVVEEWERFPGDPPSPHEAGPVAFVAPIWEQRLVFADEVML